MSKHLVGTKAEVSAYLSSCSKAMGLPRPSGREVGGGRHVEGGVATTAWAEPVEHPTKRGTWSCPVLGSGQDTSKLSTDDKEALTVGAASAVKLDKSWDAMEPVGASSHPAIIPSER